MKENQIFSKEFFNLDFKLISNEIKEKGFFSFERALTEDFINQIINDVENCGLSLNNNNVGGVYYTRGSQFFLTHMLAVSKSFFNYCTNIAHLSCCWARIRSCSKYTCRDH